MDGSRPPHPRERSAARHCDLTVPSLRRGPGSSRDPGRTRVDELGESGERRRIGRRQDAVPEVEDVAGPPGDGVEDPDGRPLDAVEGPEENGRVEISLHAVVGADQGPTALDRQRQSRPITSPPAAAIEERRWVAPVAK